MSRLDFLFLVLQSSNGFHFNFLSFQVFSILTLTVYEGHDQLIPVGFFVFHWVFSEWSRLSFLYVSMFSEGPSFFVLFVCNKKELKLRLKMEALPTSVTVS